MRPERRRQSDVGSIPRSATGDTGLLCSGIVVTWRGSRRSRCRRYTLPYSVSIMASCGEAVMTVARLVAPDGCWRNTALLTANGREAV